MVVLVPASVAEKWPREWRVFSEHCLPSGHGLRGSRAVRRGSKLLKLLDDPPESRRHLIFATHTALTSTLTDPLIRLALLRQATRHSSEQDRHRRRALARNARELLKDRRFGDNELVASLLEAPPRSMAARVGSAATGYQLIDDPVPEALLKVLPSIDLSPVRQAPGAIPQRANATFSARLADARKRIDAALAEVWKASLRP